MQTAVWQATPHPVDNLPDNAINIGREVTVVLEDAEGSNKIGLTSSPSLPNDELRSKSSHGAGDAPSMLSNVGRPKSESAMTNFNTHFTDGMAAMPRMMQKDRQAEEDRQTMRDLVNFLRSSKPPPENFMSIPEHESPPVENNNRRSSFKLFRKYGSGRKSKRYVTTNLLQLPDSAVAATTIKGHRHIAISIPLEHHPLEPGSARDESKQTNMARNSHPRHGTVTVLKPVMEDRESPVPNRTVAVFDDSHLLPNALENEKQLSRSSTPAVELLGDDAADTMTTYYRQQRKAADAQSDATDKGRLVKNYAIPAVSPILRHDSTHTDPRHSGGTAYSERSLASAGHGHSRDVSAVSTAPSTQLSNIGPANTFPARKSSITKNTKASDPTPVNDGSVRTELSAPSDTLLRSSALSTKSIAASTISDTSAVVASAEIAHAYPGAIRRESTCSPPAPGPAPNRKLPDLPEGTDDCQTAKAINQNATENITPSSPLKSSPLREVEGSGSLPSASEGIEEALRMTRRSRKERVEARIRRDLAAEATRKSSHATLTSTSPSSPRRTPTPNSHLPRLPPSPVSSHHRHSSTSLTPAQKELLKRLGGAKNSLSPIMIVAEYEPYSGTYRTSEYVFPSPPGRGARYSTRSSRRSSVEIHTPPRSASPSLPSSDDESTCSGKHMSGPITPTRRSLRNSTGTRGDLPELEMVPSGTAGNMELEDRRSERRNKRNSMLWAKDIDERMERMEKSVTELVRMNKTVIEVGKQLGTLTEILRHEGDYSHGKQNPSDQVANGKTANLMAPQSNTGHDTGSRNLGAVEGLMKELKVTARVSKEDLSLQKPEDGGHLAACA
jgi:hypothetical protein